MKVDILKLKFLSVLLLFFIGAMFTHAQTRSTKETKVVFIVSQKTNKVSGLELFETQNSKNVLPEKYPESKFYLGILKGTYELTKNVVQPKSGAIITIYTNKQLFSEGQFSSSDNVKIGRVKTIVVSRKNGEIILKTI